MHTINDDKQEQLLSIAMTPVTIGLAIYFCGSILTAEETMALKTYGMIVIGLPVVGCAVYHSAVAYKFVSKSFSKFMKTLTQAQVRVSRV